MMTPSQITWQAHGSPRVESCSDAHGLCYLCGGTVTRGAEVDRWMGSNFTDQTRARFPCGAFVCEACVYITSRVSPVLGRDAKEGKKFGGCFRNYSHCADERGYFNASKGEKPKLREFFAREHQGAWFCSVAESGQKHVLPFAQLNGPGRAGVALLDDSVIQIPEDVSLIDEMMVLLTAGATKETIESGSYNEGAWRRCEEAIRAFERKRATERGSGWFTLALWLAQRDEEEVQARLEVERVAKEEKHGSSGRKGTARRNRERPGGTKRGVHTDVGAPAAEALAEVRAEIAPEPERSVIDRPVAREDARRTRNHEHEQLVLFGAGESGPMPRHE